MEPEPSPPQHPASDLTWYLPVKGLFLYVEKCLCLLVREWGKPPKWKQLAWWARMERRKIKKRADRRAGQP